MMPSRWCPSVSPSCRRSFTPALISRSSIGASRRWLAMVAGALLLAACTQAGRRGIEGAARPAADSATMAAIAREQGAAHGALRTLGVTPFRFADSESSLSPLGFALADLLTTDLSRSARLQLVERARLGEVIRELDLAKSGRVDSATAPRVGLLLQAQQLLLGSLDTLPGGALRLSVRIADVETGVVQQAIDARAPLSDVLAAEKIVAFRLF
ncbi:MAG: CsgG/HfaB family protein, partial [Gemmatimonadaceae bacterium]